MWYPPSQQHPPPSQQQQQQQQQYWHGYIRHLSPQQQQQQQQTYSRTSYYCSTEESSTSNRTTTYVVPRNDENESFVHYQTTRADDIYVTASDYYVTTSTGSYGDEMSSSSSLSSHNSNTHWNPVIAAPTKTSVLSETRTTPAAPSSSSPSASSTACWDWLLYPPESYSHLYIPSSSFVHQQQKQDDDLDLLASLPTWLLALLYPTMKQFHLMDDENENDQEMNSLQKSSDEPLLAMNIEKKSNHVSSNLSLSSENSLHGQPPILQNRSSTPDTDDGYQSASDASRSDYSQQSSLHYDHHNSKDDITINVPSSLMPRRISYAAAVKPMGTSGNNNNNNNNNKGNFVPTTTMKTKNNSSLITNESLNTNGQKLKFIAPRFERMHHAKQYSSSTTTTTTTMKDSSSSSSSSSSTSLSNRTQIRSNNNYHQRTHIINSTRRR